jgi:hypothetical protein
MSGRTIAGALFAITVATACSRTFETTVIQPNPLVRPTETLRTSEHAVIITGDMELRVPEQPGPTQRVMVYRTKPYPLRNEARFNVVSRDRLRFHVQLEHKWQEWADLRSWEVYFEDDTGRRFKPESVEHAKTKHLVSMWDREVQTARRNRYGDIVALNDDGWRDRQTLGSLSVFRGNADFVFYRRDLFHPKLKWIRLIVKRPGQSFRFRWTFDDDVSEQTAQVW